MCKPCNLAADIQTEAYRMGVSDKSMKRFKKVATELHDSCKGSTHCTCQHHLVEPGKHHTVTEILGG